MESPHKRLRHSPPAPQEAEADFVSISVEDNEVGDQYGYSEANDLQDNSKPDGAAPRAPRAMYQQQFGRNVRNDPRNAKDKPKSKHPLPGYEPWILIKTRYGRRFVHNTETKESFWRFPPDIVPAVKEFDASQNQQKEKEANAKWAEEQLKQMREEQSVQARKEATKDDGHGRARRRRSESLQREDEAALMAEMAAETARAEEMDAKETLKAVEPLRPKTVDDVNGGYGSDSSYEVIEVTDSEFEDEEAEVAPTEAQNGSIQTNAEHEDDGPMEFGEDDIAYQLAAMEQDYDEQDEGMEEGSQPDEQYDDEDDEMTATIEEDTAIFRAMLDDHRISPFTPWEKLLADESENGIILDERYTALPNMRTRKGVWEEWVKDTAARLKAERAKAETQDPKVPYLAFLAENASPKLYWPEFKRKNRKEAVLNDRKLGDKDRERLYRDHINRLKLPERTRKADLIALLKSIPLKELNKESTMGSLPQQLLSHLHFISLPTSSRNEIVISHISSLPVAPTAADEEDGELTAEQHAAVAKREHERRKQDDALRARARQVEEEREKARRAERFAKRDLREEENELRRAMELVKGRLEGQRKH